MISPKKLIKMARKWQTLAASGRKRISLQRSNRDVDANSCSASSVADKGHFVVYSSDRRRFVIPLAYLSTEIFRELFQTSEDEFGIQSDGPIILPCDSVFMDYIISFIHHGVAKDLERALVTCSHFLHTFGATIYLHTFFRNRSTVNNHYCVPSEATRLKFCK